ncbi:molybdopterin-binding protein [Aquicoccus porphyridii]|uniref:Molybdopterin-binding protein n=1 Tax=Aquicoccus porphyridii TaxID=1852029 RepID=A0A5A9ZTY1_9RHOB|nr:molybdopterin-binding protein [Aquicoccus porphyridii]KAA0920818.1 molybdopterin-binding protein [Aquicoccus porphyridii]RAI56634.1 molybdopterin biosynthesis protein [Rhodobacteraceae bacterium AsT-22]
MKFGPAAIKDAEGAILAHSVTVGKKRLRKGQVLSADHIVSLEEAGITDVTVARLGPGDLHEDEAASLVAAASIEGMGDGLSLSRAFTGRVNVIADGPGVVLLDAVRLREANRVNPMITVATVPPFQQMASGGMVATVKIISYGVPGEDVARAADHARGSLRLARPEIASASLIVTEIAGGAGEKGRDAIAGRLEALGVELAEVVRVPHETGALAQALAGARGAAILILTGSATSDSADTGPEALRRAGGRVDRFGMPVDPGNLLFIGALGQRPVIGLPGCARSPALNGADWVLSRVVCGVEVSHEDIAAMGVGGLLKEIPTRPMPRRGKARAGKAPGPGTKS